jgi:hypothetical protein
MTYDPYDSVSVIFVDSESVIASHDSLEADHHHVAIPT